MTKTKTKLVRLFAFVLTLTMIIPCAGFMGLNVSATVESVNGSDSLVRTSLKEIKNLLTSEVYSSYLNKYKSIPDAEDEINIDISDLFLAPEEEGEIDEDAPEDPDENKYTNATYNLKEDFNGEVAILVGDDGKISYKINVAKDAMYSIEFSFFTGNVEVTDQDGNIVSSGKSAAFERMILIDGKIPYKESRSIVLQRTWIDKYTKVDEKGKPVLVNGEKQYFYSNSSDFINHVLDANNNGEKNRLFEKDYNGNETKPEKVLFEEWKTEYLYDSTGYYSEPLTFYLRAGEHVISIDSIREPMVIKSITLKAAPALPTYEQYLNSHSNASDYSGETSVIIPAEYTVQTSERTIYQLNDRSSTITMPQDPSLMRLNYIGGDKWKYTGQWVEWVVDIPESGFYNIIPRSKQDTFQGSYVSRKIYIDGVTPFEEAKTLRFNYSKNWVTNPLSSGDNELKFYFEKGEHTIKMEVVLGDMSAYLARVETSLNTINAYFRKILMITGPAKDTDVNRDYGFDRIIPDVIKGFKVQAAELYAISDSLAAITGGKGEHTASLEKVAVYIERMGRYPDIIAASMTTLKDHLAALGAWLTSTQEQPLSIDYICIQSPSKAAPKAEPGFFAAFWGEIQKFFVSFFADYNSISSEVNKGESKEYENAKVEVWTAASREQAQIIKRLVDDYFAPKYGISIEVKLVVGDTLLPATLAGTGPDVYMGSGQGDPVNYAIRTAVKSLNTKTGNENIGYNFNDLSQWSDNIVFKDIIDKIETFDTVKERFAPSAMIPITLYGETYALPDTMSFSMMFYRKDILAELDVNVPNTWDDFYSAIRSLQKNKLDIGFPGGTGGSLIWMYQQSDTLYEEGNYDVYMDALNKMFTQEEIAEKGYTYIDEEGIIRPKTDGMSINLGSDIAVSTFKQVCQLFTNYDFPVTYDFANRFRDGTMPLAIQDYTAYNQLIVFAPEIKGLWEFTPLPGTLRPDGVINNTTIGAVSNLIMMRSVTKDNALSAWAFMQWWTSAEIQGAYGNEMIALLGPSAKLNTANMEALANLSWSKDEYDNLKAQFNAVTCTPEFPGNYIIGRDTNFAFLDVVNNRTEPIGKLRSYLADINAELTRKRKEFNLPTQDMFDITINK